MSNFNEAYEERFRTDPDQWTLPGDVFYAHLPPLDHPGAPIYDPLGTIERWLAINALVGAETYEEPAE